MSTCFLHGYLKNDFWHPNADVNYCECIFYDCWSLQWPGFVFYKLFALECDIPFLTGQCPLSPLIYGSYESSHSAVILKIPVANLEPGALGELFHFINRNHTLQIVPPSFHK